jgi:sialate O-acetylesterase
MLSHRLFSLCIAGYLLTAGAHAELSVARLFSEHAVLQAEKPLPIWGWSSAGEEVTVELAGQTQKVKANAMGAWKAMLAALKSGGPHTLRVSTASGKVTAGDILVGEVWLGSGQSNMAMTVRIVRANG